MTFDERAAAISHANRHAKALWSRWVELNLAHVDCYLVEKHFSTPGFQHMLTTYIATPQQKEVLQQLRESLPPELQFQSGQPTPEK